jgi:nucleotide-binding universal stress UspA family protein
LTDTRYLAPYAIAQAKASSAHVTLVHAMPVEAGPMLEAAEAAEDRDTSSTLHSMRREIESQGVACSIVARHGSAADVVREEIISTGASRLVLGTHGRKRLAHVALGSVADELVRTVDIPIFAVGPHAHTHMDHSTPRRILHPVSLTEDYASSVCFAIDLAQVYKAELTLLHVLDPEVKKSINPERTLTWAKNALAALVPSSVDLVPPIQTNATCGNLIEEILAASATMKIDWIVLGVAGAHPLGRLRNSTAYKVLVSADCPVLTIPHPKPKELMDQQKDDIPIAIG